MLTYGDNEGKVCLACDTYKLYSEYSKSRTRKDGSIAYKGKCKLCVSKGAKGYTRPNQSDNTRRYIKKLRSLPFEELNHGTTSVWLFVNCKCELCQAARLEYYKNQAESNTE